MACASQGRQQAPVPSAARTRLRAVPDPNVIIAALLSPLGGPAQLLRAWQSGEFELIDHLLDLAERIPVLAPTDFLRRLTGLT